MHGPYDNRETGVPAARDSSFNFRATTLTIRLLLPELLVTIMPPRKRAKRAHSATPQEDTATRSSADTPGSSDSALKPEPEYDQLTDPWTDEQETALLKAIIKWKPVGESRAFAALQLLR